MVKTIEEKQLLMERKGPRRFGGAEHAGYDNTGEVMLTVWIESNGEHFPCFTDTGQTVPMSQVRFPQRVFELNTSHSQQ